MKEFVDRRDELQAFCQHLDAEEQVIFNVTGESDIGKSTFMARMIHECTEREWCRAVVACDRMTNVDCRSVMRKISKEIGKDHFESFDEADEQLGQPTFSLKIEDAALGDVQVASGATIEKSTVGKVVGVEIGDVNVNISKEYLEDMEKDRRARLTAEFIANLADISRDNKLVLFFDAVEKMPKEVEQWVMESLLIAILEGELENVKLVHCGQRVPPVEDSYDWSVSEVQLKPLGEKDIIEYLEKRGIREEHPEEIARKLLNSTKGFAGRVAKFVDAYKQSKAQ